MTGAPVRFDPLGPLPTGITLLEASAGTGKTHTIATLVVRYVAEGVPLDRLLVVTFTRMATGELRERVRRRLTQAEAGLAAAAAGQAPSAGDDVLAMLAAGPGDEVRRRLDCIRRAIADFDAATIATIDSFCQVVLDGLGVAADADRDAVFVEDLGDLVDETVDDLYVRRYRTDARNPVRHPLARALGRTALQNPLAPLVPRGTDDNDQSPHAVRVRLVEAIRREFLVRKRRLRLVTYDDQLIRLHDTLTGPVADACRARLADRYHVALIDEFQDTDPLQWEIARRAFGAGPAPGDGRRALVLIGDPKQAIYAFRGADVHTYLRAAAAATTRATLETCWRSDRPLLDALDALFGDAVLGEEGIPYRPTRATDHHGASGLVGAPVPAPLRIRMVRRDGGHIALTKTRLAEKPSTTRHIAADLAAEVARLLVAGADITDPDRSGATRPLEPGDVGVLVRTNWQASIVRDALVAAGVPAVISGAGSVFSTEAATEWRRLLEAVERPADPYRAAAAALTPFVGWDAATLAGCDDDARGELHGRLAAWRAVLAGRGVAALTETLVRDGRLAARVLARADGERHLTDLRHIAQLLHAQETDARLGTSSLVDWLTQRIDTARQEITDDRSRRLETDSEAVQVLTIHRAKGLEFPVVCVPYLWDPGRTDRPAEAVPVFHDPDDDDRRTVDVGGPTGPGFGQSHGRWLAEQRGEDLRLAYVALTRARHQVLVWWAACWEGACSPLARLVVDRAPGGAIPVQVASLPDDDAMRALLDDLAARCPGCVSVETTGADPAPAVPVTHPDPGTLVVAPFGRDVDHAWGRHSYSRLTDGTHERRVASEPEPEVRAGDEAAPAGPRASAAGPRPPLTDLPAGTAFGSLVHEILEAVDFTDPDLEAAIRDHAVPRLARGGVDPSRLPDLVSGLALAVRTPLGAALGGRALSDIPPADRLDELGFELPLAGGDVPTGVVTVDDLARVMKEHLPAGDPLAGYPAVLRAAGLDGRLRGFLVGFVDLVVRLPAPGGDARYAVVDHKTNLLGGPGGGIDAYAPGALAHEMAHTHYALQALIYQVALHRYLRWRLPGYDPDRHLGGAHYLFLRALTGPGGSPRDPVPGVFSWHPPAALVVAVSDLFHTGGPA